MQLQSSATIEQNNNIIDSGKVSETLTSTLMLLPTHKPKKTKIFI